MRFLLLVFFLFHIAGSLGAQNKIVSFEYWFDHDYAGRVLIDVAPSGESELNMPVNAGGLTAGLHVMHLRSKDEDGVYSSTVSHFFFKQNEQVTGIPRVKELEYWFDNDRENAVKIVVPQAGEYELNEVISASGFSDGLHSFHIRALDNNGLWSNTLSGFFFKSLKASEDLITGYRYWLDDDYSGMKNINLTSPVPELILTDSPELGNYPSGDYLIHFQFRDNKGIWSPVTTDIITINSNSTGIDDDRIGEIKLFPNPTNGPVTLEIDQPTGTASITVRDSSGKIILHRNAGSEKIITFDINGPGGVYFITVDSGDQKKILRVIRL